MVLGIEVTAEQRQELIAKIEKIMKKEEQVASEQLVEEKKEVMDFIDKQWFAFSQVIANTIKTFEEDLKTN